MAEERPEEVQFPWEGRILSVTNLAYHVRPSDLRDLFAPRGKVLRVDIERSKEGGTNGLGFVEFASRADCEAAAELHGGQFEGRTLKCKVSTMPPPELIRFYIRALDDRPISDRVRRRIINEASGRKEGAERHRHRKRRDEIASDGEEYSYSYSDRDQ